MDGQTDRQTDGQTDGQDENIYASSPLGGGIISANRLFILAYTFRLAIGCAWGTMRFIPSMHRPIMIYTSVVFCEHYPCIVGCTLMRLLYDVALCVLSQSTPVPVAEKAKKSKHFGIIKAEPPTVQAKQSTIPAKIMKD